MTPNDLSKLSGEILTFIKERDWEQFHSPKNLAIALSVEASELLEIFTWQKSSDVGLVEEKLDHIKDEVGDILIYLIDFCEQLQLDPIECASQKMKKNREKYPINKAKGNSTKYTEL
jgi:NTP pyrophosphatase (non-canonical NTP hydrolase)